MPKGKMVSKYYKKSNSNVNREISYSMASAPGRFFTESMDVTKAFFELFLVGYLKKSDELFREFVGLDAIKTEKDLLQNEVKIISRAVMRNPDPEVLNSLYILHAKMKEQFAHMSDEALEWMLGGSSKMSHGGFKNAESFRNFLNKDPHKISASRLSMGIETVATAIGYRSIHASWTQEPTTPVTPEQKKMDKVIQCIIGDRRVPSIGEVYTSRGQDDVGADMYRHRNDDVFYDAGDISDASDVDEVEEKQPLEKTPSRRFRQYTESEEVSWIGAAEQSNVPAQAHVSGTAPLTLAAIHGLFESGERPNSYFNHAKNIRKLAGNLLVAPFLRGGFHTTAETVAGIEHYIVETAKKSYSSAKATPLQPQEAFTRSIFMLMEASADNVKTNLKKVAPSVISKTNHVLAETEEFQRRAKL